MRLLTLLMVVYVADPVPLKSSLAVINALPASSASRTVDVTFKAGGGGGAFG